MLTHDLIGLGEDGPTHQPVEHLRDCARSRTQRVPPLPTRSRPRNAGRLALGSTHTPSALALSRQNLPTLRTSADDNLSAPRRLCDAAKPTARATSRCSRPARKSRSRVEAAKALARRGQARRRRLDAVAGNCSLRRAKPISARCSAPRRASAIEAAARFGWDRWIGESGAFIGMPGFGAARRRPTSTSILESRPTRLSRRPPSSAPERAELRRRARKGSPGVTS